MQEKKTISIERMCEKSDAIFSYANEDFGVFKLRPPLHVQVLFLVSLYVKFCINTMRTFAAKEETVI